MVSTAWARETAISGTAVPNVWNLPAQRSFFGDAVLVVFLLAQCFDGVFTYVGVISFGPGVEANPLVAALMGSVGYAAGLVAAKSIAIAFGSGLHLRGVHSAVAFLAAFYLLVALLPWMAILFT